MTDESLFYAGGSMWPTFRPGDRLFIEHCSPADLRAGEVVVFRGSRLVVHRVLRVERRGDAVLVHTQGDRSPRADPPWDGSRLVGRVVSVSPVKGRTRRLAPAPTRAAFLRAGLRLARTARRAARKLFR